MTAITNDVRALDERIKKADKDAGGKHSQDECIGVFNLIADLILLSFLIPQNGNAAAVNCRPPPFPTATFHSRAGLLGITISDYSAVKQIIDQFDPFLQVLPADLVICSLHRA